MPQSTRLVVELSAWTSRLWLNLEIFISGNRTQNFCGERLVLNHSAWRHGQIVSSAWYNASVAEWSRIKSFLRKSRVRLPEIKICRFHDLKHFVPSTRHAIRGLMSYEFIGFQADSDNFVCREYPDLDVLILSYFFLRKKRNIKTNPKGHLVQILQWWWHIHMYPCHIYGWLMLLSLICKK